MEDQKEYYKNQAKLYQKKSKLRELVLQCDWKKDGKMLLGGKMVEYISAAKVARNFAPLLPKVGLEIATQFGEPIRHPPVGQKGEEHWTIPFIVTYIDTETGVGTVPAMYYGEAVDPRDKGLKKACTDARKLWLITDFNIEEGIDPELSGAEGTFTPRSDEEIVEIKTQIASVAVKPKAPASKPAEVLSPPIAEKPKAPAPPVPPVEKVEPVPEATPAPVEEKPKKPKTPKKKTEEPPAATPAETPATTGAQIAPGMDTEYGAKITEAQKKPLFSAFGKWILAHNGGEVSDEKFEEVKTAYRSINSNADVIRFIAMSREIKG